MKNFSYTCGFDYQYIFTEFVLKAYPIKGLYVKAGIRPGFCINPDNVSYKSNAKDLQWKDSAMPPDDEETQTEIRKSIKARNSADFVAGIGFETQNGLFIRAEYIFGISDVLETEPN